MTIITLTRATTCNTFSHARAVIDALTSLCDQAVLDIPVEALRIIDESIVPLAGAIGDFGVAILTEAGKVVFVTAFDD